MTASTLATGGEACAHGGVGLDQGRCILKLGPDQMLFTGFQPDKSVKQFCDDIPDVDHTIIVLDALQAELRNMTLEFRIVRDVGQKGDDETGEANTEYHVPPKKYETGTLSLEHDFAKEGNYVGIVKARTDDGEKEYVSRFPFTVGETARQSMLIAVFGAFIGLLGLGFWLKRNISNRDDKVLEASKTSGRTRKREAKRGRAPKV